MVLDADVVAVSPSSVYHVLKSAGDSLAVGEDLPKERTGFQQPVRPHEHWHINVSHGRSEITGLHRYRYRCAGVVSVARLGCHGRVLRRELERSIREIIQLSAFLAIVALISVVMMFWPQPSGPA